MCIVSGSCVFQNFSSLCFCYYRVLAGFCLIHILVSTMDRRFYCLTAGKHTTDTDRKFQPVVSGNLFCMNAFLYLSELIIKNILYNTGHHKKEFISSVTYQHISFTNVPSDHLHNRIQCLVSCIMAKSIVIYLKIIQVDHSYTCRQHFVSEFIFIISSVICTCQCICI